MLQVSISDKYRREADGTLVEMSAAEPCRSEAFFYIRDLTRSRSATSIGKTFFVMVVLTAGVMLFTNDSTTLVIEPIERMMSIVQKLAENPLESTSKKQIPIDSNKEAEKAGYETMLLEDTQENRSSPS